jgi:hypothetical protein
MKWQADMQRERTRTGRLGIKGRYLALAASAMIVLAAAGITIPLAVLSGGTSRPARPSSSAEAPPTWLAVTSFAGYAGQPALPGAPRLEVNAIASAGGQRLAAGSADGYPAIWRQDPGGAWTLVTSPDSRPARPAPATLTSVTHGPAGWLAVGVPGPVVLTSANGTTWRPAAGNIAAGLGKISVVSAAAGPRGYVILGKLAVQGGCVADVWWSANLTSWTRAHDVNGTKGSSQTLAVAALADGFVSVGSHNGRPAAWVTSDGTTWRTIVLSGPANAQLNQIAVSGPRVVATGGSDGQGDGSAAFAVSSPDGGATWQQAGLRLPAPGTVVTALAAGQQGWIAAGRYGTPGRPRVVVWELAPGTNTWGQAQVGGITGPGPGKTPEITALGVSQDAVTGIGPAAPALSQQAAVFTLPAR